MACCTLLGLLVANGPALFRKFAWAPGIAAAFLLVELPAAGYWIYRDHRDHLAALAAGAWGATPRERLVQVPLCSGGGAARIPLQIRFRDAAGGARHASSW